MKTIFILSLLVVSVSAQPPKTAKEMKLRQECAEIYKRVGYDFDPQKMTVETMRKEFARREEAAEFRKEMDFMKKEIQKAEAEKLLPGDVTPDDIRRHFASMGNIHTTLVVGRKDLYSRVNLKEYLKVVEAIREDLDPTEDGVRVTDVKGRRIEALTISSGYWAIKDKSGFPQANLAMGFATDGNRWVGITVIEINGSYYALRSDKYRPVISKNGFLGIDLDGGFMKFVSLEFDCPQ